MNFTSQQLTASRLERLAQLVRKQQVSEVMARTLDKLFELEREESLRQLQQIQGDIEEFEAQYGMDSATFYRKYQAGETDDRMDFVEWASLVQMAGGRFGGQSLQIEDGKGGKRADRRSRTVIRGLARKLSRVTG